ncbi:membrane-bound inhibitor of C-type lysozyme [Hydrogenophaga palleronii]|uniref:Membrane-bound inhibitor of C-type lysozyme n=1 Tax=Hydrogenophaga palleronii TaxID=65655 RepID=A0ABU1WT48_9BURK|nr:MliC family protein [Hydrogenophaga palleronii]MDR7152475.1 membrane-bound inhibitor of C-type lysozyme [Hydrogenophaga palleronii]
MHLPTSLRLPALAALLLTLSACAGTGKVPLDTAPAMPAEKKADPSALTGTPLIVGPDFSTQTVRFRCTGGTELDVVYLNLPENLALAALHHNGRTALLQNRPTASGARYVALDEQHSLRWHTKGSEGFLAFMAADHTAKEQVLLSDCRALPTP